MNAFCASVNFDAFMLFHFPTQPGEICQKLRLQAIQFPGSRAQLSLAASDVWTGGGIKADPPIRKGKNSVHIAVEPTAHETASTGYVKTPSRNQARGHSFRNRLRRSRHSRTERKPVRRCSWYATYPDRCGRDHLRIPGSQTRQIQTR